MDRNEKIKRSNLGLGIAIAGILSTLLSFLPLELLLLAWIDFFGETVGWIIRISLIAIGLVLYYKYDVPDIEDEEIDMDLDE
ncbi:hypothetical protein [Maribacter sp. 2308TA10-17]|uniref:hypothetical protein n=1 Tax=Maribacter sp. 2308TA10-17 TaxID=3386276 RepID=UPI0039BD3169